MNINRITNWMIIAGTLLFAYPLISATSEDKNEPTDAQEVNIQDREKMERERLQKAIEEARKNGDILKADKNSKEVFLNGKPATQWPEKKNNN